MRAFLVALMPYTRKARAAFIGFILSALVALAQDPGLAGWIGTLPRPWNSIALAGLPVALAWLVRERGNYDDFGN